MWIDWTESASSDLLDIIRYIQNDDPQAAARTAGRILDAVNTLANFPASGRPGRAPGTRELILAGLPYLLPYVVQNERIVILRVLHTSRKWPVAQRNKA